MSDASDMLAAALEQMDGIIAGSKALEYSNGIFDCQSPTSPFMGSLRALHLVEDLRGLLEMMETDEKEGLRCQIPDSTAEMLIEWLQNQMTNGHLSGNGDVYQKAGTSGKRQRIPRSSGKCVDRPGGGSGREDSGFGVLS